MYFEIAVTGERGSPATIWVLEGGSVAGMVQSGWSERTLEVGDAISVEGAFTSGRRPWNMPEGFKGDRS